MIFLKIEKKLTEKTIFLNWAHGNNSFQLL